MFRFLKGIYHHLLQAAVALFLSSGIIVAAGTDTLGTGHNKPGAAITIDGDTLFLVYDNLGPFTPEQRAEVTNEKLRSILKGANVDSTKIVVSGSVMNIVRDSVIITTVTEEDAATAGVSMESLARNRAAILNAAIKASIKGLNSRSTLTAIGISVGLGMALVFAFWGMTKVFPRLYVLLESLEGKLFRPVRIRSKEILSAGSLSSFFILLAKGTRLVLSLALLYFFLTYTLSLFPWTQRFNVRPVLIGILLSVLTTTLAMVFFRSANTFFRLLIRKVIGWKGTIIKPIKLKTVEIVSAGRIAETLAGTLKILKVLFIFFLGYSYLTILFSFFEFTKNWASTLFGYIVDPLLNVFTAFIGYLPNLFFILVIAYVTRYVIKLVKLIFVELGKGTLSLPGFYQEWADPTYKIVRFLILAFAAIVIFPYLPGSNSPIFQGVSIFLGVLFSLGSTSAIANIVGGVVITYMRPFKIGDRVRIADTVGDITEKTLLVTRVRTIKNVDITIPNAMVLGSHIINFSSSAAERGLVLHTSVTIGYDAPWKKVHSLLLAAADATSGVLKEPAPFVLQTSLDDFYVRYELNVSTDQPNAMAGIYSELHQHIQDKFNEAGVEIMSPHYSAMRDGNRTAIPRDYLPESYQAPAFRLFPFGPQSGEPGSKKSE
jgi:small-conductance mechanosensitive channel